MMVCVYPGSPTPKFSVQSSMARDAIGSGSGNLAMSAKVRVTTVARFEAGDEVRDRAFESIRGDARHMKNYKEKFAHNGISIETRGKNVTLRIPVCLRRWGG